MTKKALNLQAKTYTRGRLVLTASGII